MSSNIIHFPGASLDEGERLDALNRFETDANALAPSLGSRDDWMSSAIDHLKVASSGHSSGAVTVSVAALHLVLSYVEQLEGREVAGGAA